MTYFLQQCEREDCCVDPFGNTETWVRPEPRVCPHCKHEMAVHELPADDRMRARLYALAEGLGFIQNATETRFLGEEPGQ